MVFLQNILQALSCNGGLGRESAHLLVKVFRKGVVEDQHQRNDRKKKEPGTPGRSVWRKIYG